MMKTQRRLFAAAALAILSSGTSLFAATKATPVNARPAQVTVYPQGARVTREGAASLPAGAVTVVFDKVPADALEDSLRLSAKGPKGTKLYGVRFAEVFSSDAVLERRRNLEKQVQGLEDDKNVVADRINARQTEMDMLRALGNQGATQVGAAKAGLATLPHDLALLGKRMAELSASNRSDSKVVRSLQERIDALRKELAGEGGDSRQMRRVEAELELATEGEVSFTLVYQVASASWAPIYDLRLEGDHVAISFSGDLRQQSGEDWDQVQVELSTARPAAFAEIPDPSEWWLDYPRPVYSYAPSPQTGKRKQAMAPSAMSMDLSTAKSGQESYENVAMETAQTLQSAYAVSFVVKRALSVPSDGATHRVGVAETSHPAEILLVAVPRLDPAAFIQAEISYQGQEPLLPGQAQLFREGEFIGKTRLAGIAPGEKFKLGFGKDDQVKVQRKRLEDKSGSGFLAAKRRYRWQTTLENFHGNARKIEVREQLPRSRQKEIEVTAQDLAPRPEKEDDSKPGLLVWKLELKPKVEQKVLFGYQVSFPEGQTVTGLE